MPQTPKQPKGLATMSTATILQGKSPEKAKAPKFKINPHLANGDSTTPKI